MCNLDLFIYCKIWGEVPFLISRNVPFGNLGTTFFESILHNVESFKLYTGSVNSGSVQRFVMELMTNGVSSKRSNVNQNSTGLFIYASTFLLVSIVLFL